jgi:hypothetical protein
MTTLNYFEKDSQALKQALITAPETEYTNPAKNGTQINGYDAKGNQLFVINYINPVMGWQIGYFVNNLHINQS